jgi:CHAT domain-containing protein/tetratricopeptide (TPR) repeat protein
MNRHRRFRILAIAVLPLAVLLTLSTIHPAHAAPLPQEGDDATLRVINESEETICYVYICAISTQSADYCLIRETILPDEFRVFDLAPNYYNLGLGDCEGEILFTEPEVSITTQYELRFTGTTLCDELYQNGMSLYSQGEYNDAVQEFKKSLDCYRDIEINSRQHEGNTLNMIGDSYYGLMQYEQALDYYQQALELYIEFQNSYAEELVWGDIGTAYSKLGKYEQAILAYQEMLQIAQDSKEVYGQGVALNILGDTYGYTGQYRQSLDYYQQALSVVRASDNQIGEWNALNGIGWAYTYLGEYEQAIDHYQQALKLAHDIGDRTREGVAIGNIGAVYHFYAQYEQAVAQYQQSLEIAYEVDDQESIWTQTNNIGAIYSKLGQHEQALDHYLQALEVVKSLRNQYSEATVLNNIGSVYRDLGQYGQALVQYEKALEVRRELGDQGGEAFTLRNIGLTKSYQDQHGQALEYCLEALKIQQEIGDQYLIAATLNDIGKIYYDLGWYQEASDSYRQSITVIEVLRENIKADAWKTSFAAEMTQPYQGIIRALHSLDRPDEAFHYAQRAKARTFLDQIGNVRVDPRPTDDPKLIEQEQALLAEIRGLEAVLSGQQGFETLSTRGGGPNTLTNEQRNEVRIRLDDAYREYEHLLAQIKRTNPAYADLRAVDASTLITVQQTLPAETTLVEYYVVSSTQTLAFVVTPDAFHTVPLSVSVEALYQKIDWFRQFTSEEESRATAQLLYDWLFAPVREYIDTRAVLIAPHQRLHYLPFDALHDGERYQVEAYAIGYLPSASVLRYLNAESQRRRDAAEEALVLGNPENPEVSGLPGAEAEARAVAGLFGVSPYLNAEATESLLWDEITGIHYVHVAAHGAFNATAPQFSRIYLTPSEAGDAADEDALSSRADGLLETREVWNLPLEDADLVTLSACQTQLGDLSAGDELVGLSRAFIYAGTPSLVASLWSVEDESTAYLMERFYGYLQGGMSKGAALRQAKLDTMAEYPSPYHWAAFTLIGDMGAAEIEPPQPTPESTPPDDAGGGGGICPGMALPLALGAVAWYEDQRQRRRG